MNATDGVKRDVPTTASPESWDVTTNLGTTALMVAALRAAETAQDDPLVRDDFATVLVTAVSDPGWLAMAQREPSWIAADDDVGRRTARTGREYIATRTVFFDEFCSAATMSGIRQVVILAAGLDARAYRLACLADVMTTAEMATYVYDQIDQVRAELNAVSK